MSRLPSPRFPKWEVNIMLNDLALAVIDGEEIVSTTDDISLVGIYPTGLVVANALAQRIQTIAGLERIPVGGIDVALYLPSVGRAAPFGEETMFDSIEDKRVIIVDGAMRTGRSLYAAMQAIDYQGFQPYGRPATVKAAILFDMGCRELPLSPDYCAKGLPPQEQLPVTFEVDGRHVVDGDRRFVEPLVLA